MCDVQTNKRLIMLSIKKLNSTEV